MATLTYDTLARRHSITFHDNSTQAYSYDAADRITQIVHTYPSSPSNNVTLSYAYDPADRDASLGNSNSAYSYAPAASTVSYATADTLNRISTVGSTSQTYWPEGPLSYDGTNYYFYNEEGHLVVAEPGSNAYAVTDSVGPLGETYNRIHYPDPTFADGYDTYYGQDGLHAETALEWVYYCAPGATCWTYEGLRQYALGPNPDERLAFMDVNNAIYYPHTDREGTTIALSNSSSVGLFQYDPYGKSANVLNEDAPDVASYPYRYTGQRLDPVTGFYFYKARDYDPNTGVFLQPDPLGLKPGMNMYQYVSDDPVDNLDSTGMDYVGDRTAFFASGSFGGTYVQPPPPAPAPPSSLAPAVRADGTTITDPHTHKPMLIPKKVSVGAVAAAGRAAGLASNVAPGAREATAFTLFRKGGSYDVQRVDSTVPGGKIDPKLIATGNYLFGVFAASSGMTPSEALEGAAAVNAFGPGDKSGPYRSNPTNDISISQAYTDYFNDNLPK